METIVDLVRGACARFPEHTAVVMRSGLHAQRLTYEQLDRRAGGFAQVLEDRGVQPGDRVVIWAANQPDWVAAMLGTYIVGGAIVPLDVRSSRDFAERVIEQTDPRLAIAGPREALILRDLKVPVLELPALVPAPEGRAECAARPGDLAEVVFTSGTTGDPKGVMLTHTNIVSNTRAALQVITLDSGTVALSLLPLSHMFEQVGGCLAPLAVGGAIVYPVSRQPASLLRTMSEFRPTAMMLVPQALRLLMNGIEREAAAQGRMASLRRLRRVAVHLPMPLRRMLFRPILMRLGGQLGLIASGGAALDQELRETWEAMGIPVLEGYGTSECSPILTISPRRDRRAGSCGVSLPGQEIRIAPDGEVLARGPHVFQGYWRNEAATAAAFEDGWYRTGDLGSQDSDGFLYLKGRKKDMIVLADGQNVYPEDVERELLHQPGIHDAVVLGREEDGIVRLHAVLLAESERSAAAAVRGANARLDSRQQVLGFSVWPGDDLPRTHTLKVRRGLVAGWLEGQKTAVQPGPAVADADPLISLVARTTRTEHDVDDNLQLGPDIGLDSLGRVELLSAIEEELGVYVDDAEVGPATTIGELRKLIARAGQRQGGQRFPQWPRKAPARWIRNILLPGMVFPLLRIGYRVQVRGRRNLRAIERPCLIICNHHMHLDNGILLMSMPRRFRRQVAIAAAASDIFSNRFQAFLAGLIGNGFPFAKEGAGVRDSLEHVARLLDQGWNVLIYPEGRLTVMGPMQPFKSGIGLLATETGAQVLPLRIDILRPGFYEGKWLPHPRATVRVSFGPPVTIPVGTGHSEATALLETAVLKA